MGPHNLHFVKDPPRERPQARGVPGDPTNGVQPLPEAKKIKKKEEIFLLFTAKKILLGGGGTSPGMTRTKNTGTSAFWYKLVLKTVFGKYYSTVCTS